MNFIVCSYGGCGSWMLLQYFSRFGEVHHCHSRSPPSRLTKIKEEHFTDEELHPDVLAQTRVVYLYRDPCAAMASVGRRWKWEDHLKNIEADANLTPNDVGDADPFGLAEFQYNYTMTSKRNYNILCVKYEELWENWSTLNAALCLPDVPAFYQPKTESSAEPLKKPVWEKLAEEMKTLPALFFAPFA